jgi:hypothetical protein
LDYGQVSVGYENVSIALLASSQLVANGEMHLLMRMQFRVPNLKAPPLAHPSSLAIAPLSRKRTARPPVTKGAIFNPKKVSRIDKILLRTSLRMQVGNGILDILLSV